MPADRERCSPSARARRHTRVSRARQSARAISLSVAPLLSNQRRSCPGSNQKPSTASGESDFGDEFTVPI